VLRAVTLETGGIRAKKAWKGEVEFLHYLKVREQRKKIEWSRNVFQCTVKDECANREGQCKTGAGREKKEGRGKLVD